MPCDSIVVFNGQLDKCKDWDMLEAAAKEAGWYVYRQTDKSMHLSKGSVNIQLSKGGKAQISGPRLTKEQSDEAVKDITVAYAKKVVTTSAKKWGWSPQEQPGGKIRLTRRF